MIGGRSTTFDNTSGENRGSLCTLCPMNRKSPEPSEARRHEKNEVMPRTPEEIPDFRGRAVYFPSYPDGALRHYGFLRGSSEFLLQIADRVEAVHIKGVGRLMEAKEAWDLKPDGKAVAEYHAALSELWRRHGGEWERR